MGCAKCDMLLNMIRRYERARIARRTHETNLHETQAFLEMRNAMRDSDKMLEVIASQPKQDK